VISVPPALVKGVVLEALENGIRLAVVVTERVPRKDTIEFLEVAKARNARIIGPNTLGLISPGKVRLGMAGGPAADVRKAYMPGPVGIASRSGGMLPKVESPEHIQEIHTPFMIDLKDLDALRADARRAKQLGFQGKLCTHPSQVGPCNEIFSPTAEELAYARRVVEAFEKSEAEGVGALQLDGRFIDYPVLERSRRIIRLGASIDPAQ
jgi:hypothetical protein